MRLPQRRRRRRRQHVAGGVVETQRQVEHRAERRDVRDDLGVTARRDEREVIGVGHPLDDAVPLRLNSGSTASGEAAASVLPKSSAR